MYFTTVPLDQKPTHAVSLEAFTSNEQLKFRLEQMLNNDDSDTREAPLLWYLSGNSLHLWIGKTTYPRLSQAAIDQAHAEQRRIGVQMFKSLLSAMLIAEDNELKGVALKRLLESLPDLGNEQPDNPFNLMRAAAIELLEPPVNWAEELEVKEPTDQSEQH